MHLVDVRAQGPRRGELGVERDGAVGLAGGAVDVAAAGEHAAEDGVGARIAGVGGDGGARGGFGGGGVAERVVGGGDADEDGGAGAVDGVGGDELGERVVGAVRAQERQAVVGVRQARARLRGGRRGPQRLVVLPDAREPRGERASTTATSATATSAAVRARPRSAASPTASASARPTDGTSAKRLAYDDNSGTRCSTGPSETANQATANVSDGRRARQTASATSDDAEPRERDARRRRRARSDRRRRAPTGETMIATYAHRYTGTRTRRARDAAGDDRALPDAADDEVVRDEVADGERDEAGDEHERATARVGGEPRPGAGDAGGEHAAARRGPSPWPGAPSPRSSERDDGPQPRALGARDGAPGGEQRGELAHEREQIAERRVIGDRLDVHGQRRPQRRGGERRRAIASARAATPSLRRAATASA